MPKNQLQQRQALLVLTLAVAACATGPAREFDDFEKAMGEYVEPLVEDLLVGELAKEPSRVDYNAISSRATQVAALFGQATDPQRKIYIADSEKKRTAAQAAAAWFRSIAAAATVKQHGELVTLYRQKATICNGCHVY